MKNKLITLIIFLSIVLGVLVGKACTVEPVPKYKFILPSQCALDKLKIIPERKWQFELPGVEAYQEGHTQEEKDDWVPPEDFTPPPTGDLSIDELELVYAIVMQEGGPEYDSAIAVMSTIVNRVNNPAKWSWCGDTIIDMITYPQQYCYSLDDLWIKYLNGNVPESVKQAVNDVLQYGPSYEYDCFRGYPLEGCEHIGGNWFYIG